MAPRKQWGKTPWGGAFLQALESIDVGGGRLKRGKTIANTNKVLDFTLRQEHVTSRVQGSYEPYYNIRIGFPPLTQEQKTRILNIIQANPIMLGTILSGELPLELLETIRRQVSVALLPRRWSDFIGDCSCPDYSSSGAGYYNAAPRPASCPCKHMAGTFYVICGEFDKDPFMIFKLRGLDLLQELAISSTEPQEDSSIPYPLKVQEWESSNDNQEPHESVPLADIRSCSTFVMSCLGPNPPFSRHIDFHAALKECYDFLANSKKMRKSSLQVTDEQSVDIDGLEQLLHFSTMAMTVIQDTTAAALRIQNEMFQDAALVKEAFEGVKYKLVEPCTVVLSKTTLLSLLPLLSAPPHGGSSFGFYWWAVRLARLLVSKGAIVPDILPGYENGSWLGIWRPLATNVDVATAIDALVSMHPTFDPLVSLNETPLSPRCAVEHVLTTLCTTLVHEAGFMQKERRVSPPKESNAFFRGEMFEVEHASERSTASAIHRYFSVFSLMSSDFELELQVTGRPPDDYRVKLMFDGAPLCDFLEQIKGDPKKHAAALKLLTQLVAPQLSDTVQALLQSQDAPLSGADLQKFLLGASSTMRALGVRTIVPKELSKLLKPRLVLAPKGLEDAMSASDAKSNAQSVLSKCALVQFEWRIAIGDETLSPEEFRKLTQTQAKGVVHFKHNFVELDPTEIDHMLTAASTKTAAQPSSTDILHAALLGADAGPNVWLPPSARDIIQGGAAESNTLNPPQSLHAELRPYQLQGFRWMMGLIENGFGPVLADDMGLGKTVQTLTVLLQLQEQSHFQNVGPALIVVPTALLYNWQRETKRFAQSLRISVYHGGNRSLPAATSASPRNADSAKRSRMEPSGVDIVLTTYGTVRTDVNKLKKVGWGAIIIDEAQQIKNVASSQTKAIKQLNAPIKLALSGTPVENKLSELWSIFDFVVPGFLGTIKQFKKTFSKPIEADNDEEALANLRALTGPFLLRRLKTDPEIGKELPDKVVTDHECSLQPEQTALYQTVVDEVTEELEREKAGEGSGRSAMVLKMINDLKQICNHPHIFSPNKYGPNASLSGKCELLAEIIDPILKSGEQILIFTQYVKMLSSLVDHVIPEKHNVKPLAYHGGMSVNARDAAVKRFQNGDVPIMVVSLKAGGVGLNLTAANHVAMFDLWWNPAVEQQAIDRCFRIGQTRNVFVHRFITHGTFEVKINEMIARKRELSDMSVTKGEHWLGDLSNEELIGLLRGNEGSEEE